MDDIPGLLTAAPEEGHGQFNREVESSRQSVTSPARLASSRNALP